MLRLLILCEVIIPITRIHPHPTIKLIIIIPREFEELFGAWGGSGCLYICGVCVCVYVRVCNTVSTTIIDVSVLVELIDSDNVCDNDCDNV